MIDVSAKEMRLVIVDFDQADAQVLPVPEIHVQAISKGIAVFRLGAERVVSPTVGMGVRPTDWKLLSFAVVQELGPVNWSVPNKSRLP